MPACSRPSSLTMPKRRSRLTPPSGQMRMRTCVAETLAAVDVRRRAEDGDATERAALLAIADDEDRHAELAWRTLAWGIRSGGTPARAALAAALRELAPSEDPALAQLVRPCAAALLDEAA